MGTTLHFYFFLRCSIVFCVFFLQPVYAPLYLYSVLFPPCAILTIYCLHTLSALFTDADLCLITNSFVVVLSFCIVTC